MGPSVQLDSKELPAMEPLLGSFLADQALPHYCNKIILGAIKYHKQKLHPCPASCEGQWIDLEGLPSFASECLSLRATTEIPTGLRCGHIQVKYRETT